jgi:hypothetical protein
MYVIGAGSGCITGEADGFNIARGELLAMWNSFVH